MVVEVPPLTPKHAIVLAGGFGTRLRSVVSTVPKPLASVGGKPFLSHLFEYWSSQGITRFTILVGYLYEKITEYYGSRYEGAEIDYSIESEPLGTGGALRQAIATLDVEGSTILLLNGDTFFPISLEQLVREHTEARADASISLFRPQDYSRYASVITDERCRVKQFTLMRPEFTGKAIERPYGGANGGVYLFDQFWLRNSLSAFPSRVFSLEIDFFPSVLSSGDKVFAFPFYNYFCDIGVPEDYLRANHELSEKGTYGN